MTSDIHFLEATELGARIRSRAISPLEATRAMLDRIEALNPALKAYALVTPELALEQARQAEQEIGDGRDRGPLHGVPIAVKDNIFTKGIVTTNGMAIRRDARPDHDATVVTRLREAGAILLGKLQHTEGAFAEHHPTVAAPVNPWNADLWSGASSSGSGVATTAGLCFGSLGTDTGGSVRFPCDVNGLTGMKPTYGRISRYGVCENSPTMDHVGPMARSVADIAAMLGAMAGRDENDPTSSFEPTPDYMASLGGDVIGLRVGVDRTYNGDGVDPLVVAATEDAIETMRGLGARVIEVSIPNPHEAIMDWMPHSAIEMAVAHEATYRSRKDEYGPVLSGMIELGLSQSAVQYQKYILRRNDFRGRLAALFQEIDVLAIPTFASPAPTIARMAALGEEQDSIQRLIRFTAPFDMSGNPTIILPSGFTPAGYPMTFQLVGGYFAESLLLRAGAAFQSATDWHRRHPAI
jgi:amidase